MIVIIVLIHFVWKQCNEIKLMTCYYGMFDSTLKSKRYSYNTFFKDFIIVMFAI